MYWLILAFLSAALLGCYDSLKKDALKGNAVIPVLFLNTLFSSLMFPGYIGYRLLRVIERLLGVVDVRGQ